MDPASLLVVVLIGAFVIDRAAHAIVYVIFLPKTGGGSGASTSGSEPGKAATVLYFVVASALAIAFIAYFGPLPILRSVGSTKGLSETSINLLDSIVTFIVLVGGGEGISSVLESSLKRPAPVGVSGDPVILKGEITLKDGPKV